MDIINNYKVSAKRSKTAYLNMLNAKTNKDAKEIDLINLGIDNFKKISVILITHK